MSDTRKDAPMRDPYFKDMTDREQVKHVRRLAGVLVDLLDAHLGPFGPDYRPVNRAAEVTEVMDELAEGMARIRPVFGAGNFDPDDPWKASP